MSAPDTAEECAGALLRCGDRLLLIRRRARVLELPKGHIEPGESAGEAAARELCEETGLAAAPPLGAELGTLLFRFDRPPMIKRVRFFLFEASPRELSFGSLPRGTRALRWVARDEVASLPLRSEMLRPLLERALIA